MNKESEVMAEMPRYQSHKKVWALKIRSISMVAEGALLTFEEERYAPITVDGTEGDRIADAQITYEQDHDVIDFGYLVVYEDGYRSWSPTEAFEAGYTRI